jgi:hypothetical protein
LSAEKLGLWHTTDAYSLRNMVDRGELDGVYAPGQFGKRVSYFSIGRPILKSAFKTLTRAPAIDYAMLKKRNGWIDAIATLMTFIGLLLPFPLIHAISEDRVGYLFPLALGLAVACPFAWVCAVTLPTGRARFREFWRFYELRWGIGMRGIKLVYVPLGALGAGAAVMLWI